VDFVLRPNEIAHELARISRQKDEAQQARHNACHRTEAVSGVGAA
jgi:hypothetical protein